MTVIAGYILTFVIGNPGATYSVTGGGGFTDSGTINQSGYASTTQAYAPGSYSITFTLGSATSTQSFTVPGDDGITYYFPPLAVTDPGTSGGAPATSTAAGSTAAPTSTAPLGPQTAPVATPVPVTAADSTPQYDFSWPAYNYGRYFTPTQAFLYIGNLYIDELIGFQYTLQGNKVPVFGYASTMLDAIGTGKTLIQGQLSINFISEGYLYTVLDQYTLSSSDPQEANELAATNLYQKYVSLQSNTNASLPTVQGQLATIKQQLLQLMANNPKLPSVLASAQQASRTSSNPVYRRPPFDILLRFEGADRTVEKRIENCVLVSNEQILGTNDDIVGESYGFIARSTR